MAFRIDNATLDFEPTAKAPGATRTAEPRLGELDSWSLAEIRAHAERERAQAIARMMKQAGHALTHVVKTAVVAPARRWLAQQRTVAELRSLDDRMLRDIGVTRSEIDLAVERVLSGEAAKPAFRHSAAVEERYAGERPVELTLATRNETKKAA